MWVFISLSKMGETCAFPPTYSAPAHAPLSPRWVRFPTGISLHGLRSWSEGEQGSLKSTDHRKLILRGKNVYAA